MASRPHRSNPACLALFMLSGALSASAGATQPQPADPLSGPKVAVGHTQATIVERDMQGKLVRLDERPEAAAVMKLHLDGEHRAAAEKVLAERFAQASAILLAHLDEFTQIQSARQSGDRAAAEPLVRKFREVVQPMMDPLLVEKVAGVLSPEQAAELRRMVKEYVDALAAEEGPAGQESQGKGPARPAGNSGPRAASRVEMNLVLRELARSLSSLVTERRERTEGILKASEATPEQEADIRRIIRETGEKGAKATQDERAAVMGKIMQVLTPDQRRKLQAWLREQHGGPAAPVQPAK